MRNAIPFVLALLVTSGRAQDLRSKDVSPAARDYHAYRQRVTVPPYGLAKARAAIRTIRPTKGGGENSESLASPAWPRMSVPERFTYCMLHGEVASQNCDVMPWVVDEDKKVFAYPPPFNEGEQNWSERQLAFLKRNRRDTIRLLRATMRAKERVGVNLKAAIIEIDGYELVPDLVRAYDRDRKDQDILTVLALLMKAGRYAPFLASATYRKLYGADASYQSFVVANPANQKLMKARALAYYRTRVR